MRPTGRTGWADGRTGGRTGAQANEGSEWTSRRTSGQADRGGHVGRTSRPVVHNRWTGGPANRRTGAGGRGRTGGRRISEGKTPNLTRYQTWPWEIQRGRPRVTIKLPDLPPPSR